MAIVKTSDADGVAIVTMDDGKANAFDLDFFSTLGSTLDECAEAPAMVLAGRAGVFSAGLNTKVMAGLDDDGLAGLLVAFGRCMLRVWLEPRPVVGAVTGHAVAGGTILAMACDHTVAADGDYRWGLIETTIGFPIPRFVLAIAHGNVRADRLDDLVLPGALIDVGEAVQVGFADVAVAEGDVLDRAAERARALAELPGATYAATKRRLRAHAAEHARDHLVDDVRALLAERRATA